MKKITKRKLYGTIYSTGLISTMMGAGTFLTSYVAMNRMDPTIALTSVGVVAFGTISTAYGYFKQKYTFEEEPEEEYENIYDMDQLNLKRDELKKIESRFNIEKNSMSKSNQYVISRNILKEKLLIKKVLEELDTDNPNYEEECNLIVSMILDSEYDELYLDYRREVLSTNIVHFPKQNVYPKNKNKDAKILEFPKNSN